MRAPKIDDKTREQLKKLRQVPVEKIRGFNTPIINIPIGNLSEKDAHRALYVLSSTLISVRDQTNKLAEIFDGRETNIKKLIEKYEKITWEDDTPSQETILTDLKSLLVTADDIRKKMVTDSLDEKLPSQDPSKASSSTCDLSHQKH